MGAFMKAYTIAFENANGNEVASREIVPFFKKLEDILVETPEKIIRRINGKIMRVHAYEWNQMNDNFFVVPIGKLKEKNKPYGTDPSTQRLIDIPQDMFDVNSIAYHKWYRVALLTSNYMGPSDNDIEDYLNSFLNTNSEFKIRLRPIMRDRPLEKIRSAQEARSITISLNLGRPMNDFISDQITVNNNAKGCLKGLIEYSKMTLESKTFELKLGLGKTKKASLDIRAILDLLESINLESDCINEITVNYKNGPEEKIDIAKLKDDTTILKITFPIQGTQLGAEYILNNMDQVLRDERYKYFEQVNKYFSNTVDIGETYEIVKDWSNGPVA